MKVFVTLAFVGLLSLLADAHVTKFVPRQIIMPVNPSHTAEEWKNIMASQIQSPEYYPNFKKGSEPQPAFAGKVHVGNGRITNGQTASRGQFPWQAALFVDNSWFCGGSLISNQWVLTAAHCIGNQYQIVLGSNSANNPQSGSVVVTTSTSKRHENYNSQTIDNDIGVVKLNSPVQFSSYINAVKLPSRSDAGNTYAGTSATVSGWGITQDGATSIAEELQFVTRPVIANSQCAQTFGSVITASKICIDTTGAHSTCSGDSGGPLVEQGSDGAYTEIGVVSFVAAAGCELGYPAAFTRVTSFLDWIETNTGITIN